MKKPLNYYGYAFDDPTTYYNEDYVKTKKGKKKLKNVIKDVKNFKKKSKQMDLIVQNVGT